MRFEADACTYGRVLTRPDLDLEWWIQELADAVDEMDAKNESTPYGKTITTARWRIATTAVMQIGGGAVHWWAMVKSKTPEALISSQVESFH